MAGKKIRGSGVKHTLPFIGRFSGLWFLTTTIAVAFASVSTYLIFVDRGVHGDRRFIAMLTFQTFFIILALAGLAIFTTHRLAGPWIAVKRALEDVKNGDLQRTLRIRRADGYLKTVEDEFNAMMVSLRERADTGSTPPEPSSPTPSEPED